MNDQPVRTSFLTLIVGVTGVISFSMVQPTMATPLTFVATGTVDSVDHQLAGTFSLGDIFTVVYTFESLTPDSDPSPNRGAYVNAITALWATVGTYQAAAVGAHITVHDDVTGSDRYFIDVLGSMSGPSVGGYDLRDSQAALLQLRDPTSTAFITDALPTSPPDPADFISNGTFLALQFIDPSNPSNHAFVSADVSSIIVVQARCTDLDGDGAVGARDLAELLASWGPCSEPCRPGDPADTCTADLNGDCDVGYFDLAMLLGSWGPCE